MLFLYVSITPSYALQSNLQNSANLMDQNTMDYFKLDSRNIDSIRDYFKDFMDQDVIGDQGSVGQVNYDVVDSGFSDLGAVESVPYVGPEPNAVEINDPGEILPGGLESSEGSWSGVLPGGLESDDGVKPSLVDLEGFHQDLSVGYAKRANNALLITTGIAVGVVASIATAGLASSALLALGGTYLAHMAVFGVLGAIGGLVSGIVIGVMKGCIEGDSTDAWEHAVDYGAKGFILGFISGAIAGPITKGLGELVRYLRGNTLEEIIDDISTADTSFDASFNSGGPEEGSNLFDSDADTIFIHYVGQGEDLEFWNRNVHGTKFLNGLNQRFEVNLFSSWVSNTLNNHNEQFGMLPSFFNWLRTRTNQLGNIVVPVVNRGNSILNNPNFEAEIQNTSFIHYVGQGEDLEFWNRHLHGTKFLNGLNQRFEVDLFSGWVSNTLNNHNEHFGMLASFFNWLRTRTNQLGSIVVPVVHTRNSILNNPNLNDPNFEAEIQKEIRNIKIKDIKCIKCITLADPRLPHEYKSRQEKLGPILSSRDIIRSILINRLDDAFTYIGVLIEEGNLSHAKLLIQRWIRDDPTLAKYVIILLDRLRPGLFMEFLRGIGSHTRYQIKKLFINSTTQTVKMKYTKLIEKITKSTIIRERSQLSKDAYDLLEYNLSPQEKIRLILRSLGRNRAIEDDLKVFDIIVKENNMSFVDIFMFSNIWERISMFLYVFKDPFKIKEILFPSESSFKKNGYWEVLDEYLMNIFYLINDPYVIELILGYIPDCSFTAKIIEKFLKMDNYYKWGDHWNDAVISKFPYYRLTLTEILFEVLKLTEWKYDGRVDRIFNVNCLKNLLVKNYGENFKDTLLEINEKKTIHNIMISIINKASELAAQTNTNLKNPEQFLSKGPPHLADESYYNKLNLLDLYKSILSNMRLNDDKTIREFFFEKDWFKDEVIKLLCNENRQINQIKWESLYYANLLSDEYSTSCLNMFADTIPDHRLFHALYTNKYKMQIFGVSSKILIDRNKPSSKLANKFSEFINKDWFVVKLLEFLVDKHQIIKRLRNRNMDLDSVIRSLNVKSENDIANFIKDTYQTNYKIIGKIICKLEKSDEFLAQTLKIIAGNSKVFAEILGYMREINLEKVGGILSKFPYRDYVIRFMSEKSENDSLDSVIRSLNVKSENDIANFIKDTYQTNYKIIGKIICKLEKSDEFLAQTLKIIAGNSKVFAEILGYMREINLEKVVGILSKFPYRDYVIRFMPNNAKIIERVTNLLMNEIPTYEGLPGGGNYSSSVNNNEIINTSNGMTEINDNVNVRDYQEQDTQITNVSYDYFKSIVKNKQNNLSEYFKALENYLEYINKLYNEEKLDGIKEIFVQLETEQILAIFNKLFRHENNLDCTSIGNVLNYLFKNKVNKQNEIAGLLLTICNNDTPLITEVINHMNNNDLIAMIFKDMENIQIVAVIKKLYLGDFDQIGSILSIMDDYERIRDIINCLYDFQLNNLNNYRVNDLNSISSISSLLSVMGSNDLVAKVLSLYPPKSIGIILKNFKGAYSVRIPEIFVNMVKNSLNDNINSSIAIILNEISEPKLLGRLIKIFYFSEIDIVPILRELNEFPYDCGKIFDNMDDNMDNYKFVSKMISPLISQNSTPNFEFIISILNNMNNNSFIAKILGTLGSDHKNIGTVIGSLYDLKIAEILENLDDPIPYMETFDYLRTLTILVKMSDSKIKNVLSNSNQNLVSFILRNMDPKIIGRIFFDNNTTAILESLSLIRDLPGRIGVIIKQIVIARHLDLILKTKVEYEIKYDICQDYAHILKKIFYKFNNYQLIAGIMDGFGEGASNKARILNFLKDSIGDKFLIYLILYYMNDNNIFDILANFENPELVARIFFELYKFDQDFILEKLNLMKNSPVLIATIFDNMRDVNITLELFNYLKDDKELVVKLFSEMGNVDIILELFNGLKDDKELVVKLFSEMGNVDIILELFNGLKDDYGFVAAIFEKMIQLDKKQKLNENTKNLVKQAEGNTIHPSTESPQFCSILINRIINLYDDEVILEIFNRMDGAYIIKIFGNEFYPALDIDYILKKLKPMKNNIRLIQKIISSTLSAKTSDKGVINLDYYHFFMCWVDIIQKLFIGDSNLEDIVIYLFIQDLDANRDVVNNVLPNLLKSNPALVENIIGKLKLSQSFIDVCHKMNHPKLIQLVFLNGDDFEMLKCVKDNHDLVALVFDNLDDIDIIVKIYNEVYNDLKVFISILNKMKKIDLLNKIINHQGLLNNNMTNAAYLTKYLENKSPNNAK
jgi:hypothetical protein